MKALVNNIRRYLRIYWLLISSNLQSRMAYKLDFFLSVLSVTIDLSARLLFLRVIYSYIPTLGGWTFSDMLLLFATGFFVDAVSWFIWRAGISKLHLYIQDGSFDFLTTKPIGLLFLTSIRRIDFEDSIRIVLAGGLAVFAFHAQGIPSVTAIVFWIVAVTCAQITFYSFTLILKSTSFWTTQSQEINYILYSIDRLNQYPVTIYSHAIRTFFTFIIPVAFITTIPAAALTGKVGGWAVVGAAVFSSIIFVVARKIFYFSTRAYSSASS